MENIEQIKQERDTLQERLNNAAKFFREQKAQIEALTKENEELKSQPKDTGVSADKWNTTVTELDKLKAAYEELSETSMKKDDQIKTLKQKLDEEGQNAVANKILLEETNAMLEAKDKAYKDLEVRFNEVCEKNMIAYNELQQKYNELQQTHDEAEAKIDELNQKCADAEKQLTEGDAKLTEAEAKLTDAETKINELQKKCTEFENTIISKNQEYKNLQDTYNEVYAKLTDTKTELADAQKTNERNAAAYDELNKVCNELKSKNEELNKVCNELKSENDSLEAYYKELETEHNTLKDEFDLMKANKEIEDEVLENVINKIKQIYQITDDILDPKPIEVANEK